MRAKKVVLIGVKVAILAAMLAFLAWSVRTSPKYPDLQHRFLHPEEIHWPMLLGGWFLFFIGICLNIFRWQMLTRTLELKLSLRDALRIGLISHYVSQVGFGLGLLGGDTVRAVFLSQTNPGKGTESTMAVLMDRMIGLMSLLMLGGLSSLFLDPSKLAVPAAAANQGETYLADVILAVRILAGVTIVGSLVLLTPGLTKWSLWDLVTHTPIIGKILIRLVQAVRVYRQRLDHLILGMLMSTVTQTIFIFSLFTMTSALQLDQPPLGTVFCVAPISFVASALPIGAWEAVLEGMYLATGLTRGAGSVAALGYRLGGLVTAVVGLIVYLVTRAESAALLHQAEEQAEAEEEADEEERLDLPTERSPNESGTDGATS